MNRLERLQWYTKYMPLVAFVGYAAFIILGWIGDRSSIVGALEIGVFAVATLSFVPYAVAFVGIVLYGQAAGTLVKRNSLYAISNLILWFAMLLHMIGAASALVRIAMLVTAIMIMAVTDRIWPRDTAFEAKSPGPERKNMA